MFLEVFSSLNGSRMLLQFYQESLPNIPVSEKAPPPPRSITFPKWNPLRTAHIRDGNCLAHFSVELDGFWAERLLEKTSAKLCKAEHFFVGFHPLRMQDPPAGGPIPSQGPVTLGLAPSAWCGSVCCPHSSHHKRLKIILILIIQTRPCENGLPEVLCQRKAL